MFQVLICNYLFATNFEGMKTRSLTTPVYSITQFSMAGTGVCNGDSGGGLIFPQGHGPNSNWLLQGIVSVSPRRRGTAFCDSTYYTVFTKVGMMFICMFNCSG
jgi:hypothetical protein